MLFGADPKALGSMCQACLSSDIEGWEHPLSPPNATPTPGTIFSCIFYLILWSFVQSLVIQNLQMNRNFNKMYNCYIHMNKQLFLKQYFRHDFSVVLVFAVII